MLTFTSLSLRLITTFKILLCILKLEISSRYCFS